MVSSTGHNLRVSALKTEAFVPVSVKPGVPEPQHGWGRVSRSSVGVVKRIVGPKAVVDFPEQSGWMGNLCELMKTTKSSGRPMTAGHLFVDALQTALKFLATDLQSAQDKRTGSPPSVQDGIGIKVGDEVKVKASVKEPKFKWGSINHSSVGVVASVTGGELRVDFPEQKNWCGVLSEMEKVTRPTTSHTGIRSGCNLWIQKDKAPAATRTALSSEGPIKVGDQVRVKPSVTTPKYEWGNASRSSVGKVITLQGQDLLVDFDEVLLPWKGLISEMEKAPAVHQHVQCDHCGECPIVGLRYKCNVCDDFDLCSRCYSSFPHAGPEHLFKLIKQPGDSPVLKGPSGKGSSDSTVTEEVPIRTGEAWKTLVEKVEASSGGDSLKFLFDGEEGTCWNSSDRSATVHSLVLHLLPGAVVTGLTMQVNPQHGSYMPSVVSVVLHGSPSERKTCNIPAAAKQCQLVQGRAEHYKKIAINVKERHEDGVNCKITGLLIEGYNQSGNIAVPQSSIPAPKKAATPVQEQPKVVAQETPSTVTVRSVQVSVKQGDITEETSDIIVNSCGSDFDLSSGLVSNAIIRKGGSNIQNEVLNKSDPMMRISSGGNLPCKKIYHIAFPDVVKRIPDCIEEVLRTAEGQEFASISFPAVGTGKKGKPVSTMAAAIQKGLQQFFIGGRNISSLKQIWIVVWEESVMEEFRKSILGGLTASLPTTPAKPAPKVSETALVFNQPAIEKLRSRQDFEEKSIPHDCVAELTDWELNEIKQTAVLNGVAVIVERSEKKVTVKGARNNVWGMSMSISQIFQAFAVAKILQSRSKVAWSWKNTATSSWEDFPNRAMKILEDAYEASNEDGRRATIQIFFGNKMSRFEVDFHNMKMVGDSTITIKRHIKGDLPPHWEEMHNDMFMCVRLRCFDEEYKKVQNRFQSSVTNSSVLSISRIQNKHLYERYRVQRKNARRSCKKSDVEMHLFHGTTTSVADTIVKQGFDRNYAGKNATMFGRGVYFAKNASYSDDPKYAKPEASGEKTMLFAYVITGDYCQGRKEMLSAPVKPQGNGTEVYDCVVDDPANPRIFVVFKDGGAYPAYVIKYRLQQ